MPTAEYFRDRAAQCRRWARQITDDPAHEKWLALALEFDARAVAVDASDAVACKLDTEDAAGKKTTDGR